MHRLGHNLVVEIDGGGLEWQAGGLGGVAAASEHADSLDYEDGGDRCASWANVGENETADAACARAKCSESGARTDGELEGGISSV